MFKTAALWALIAGLPAIPVAGQTLPVPAQGGSTQRTADGQPDIQGTWTNATVTPLERPAAFGDKAVLTELEALAFEREAAGARAAQDEARPGDVGTYNQFWFDPGTKMLSTRQTSLVTRPANGRVPVRPEAEAFRDFNLARSTDSYEHMSVWDRCISRGMPGGMIPAGYNNAYQIIQTPGFVVIHQEMIHDARIIPLDGRPPLPPSVRLWDGDSRGRWEGDTLVIETTNFKAGGWIATSAAAGRIKGIPHTETLRVVERFTRVDRDTLRYEATIEDPAVFSEPWVLSFPLTRDDGYRVYEYACHEANYAVENILRGGRYEDRTAAEATPR